MMRRLRTIGTCTNTSKFKLAIGNAEVGDGTFWSCSLGITDHAAVADIGCIKLFDILDGNKIPIIRVGGVMTP